VGVLWAEMWHEALEEASRQWFGGRDFDVRRRAAPRSHVRPTDPPCHRHRRACTRRWTPCMSSWTAGRKACARSPSCRCASKHASMRAGVHVTERLCARSRTVATSRRRASGWSATAAGRSMRCASRISTQLLPPPSLLLISRSGPAQRQRHQPGVGPLLRRVPQGLARPALFRPVPASAPASEAVRLASGAQLSKSMADSTQVELQCASPQLLRAENLELAVPGTYGRHDGR
jgi:hypothetical protein